MIPRVGPALYTVTGISDVPIPSGTSLQRVQFRWPRDLFVTGVLLFAKAGAPAANANLELQIEDETFQQMFSDGQGQTFAVPALALNGGPLPGAGAPPTGARAFALQRPVRKGDLWFISVANVAVDGTAVPELFFYFDEAYAYAPRHGGYSYG